MLEISRSVDFYQFPPPMESFSWGNFPHVEFIPRKIFRHGTISQAFQTPMKIYPRKIPPEYLRMQNCVTKNKVRQIKRISYRNSDKFSRCWNLPWKIYPCPSESSIFTKNFPLGKSTENSPFLKMYVGFPKKHYM